MNDKSDMNTWILESRLACHLYVAHLLGLLITLIC